MPNTLWSFLIFIAAVSPFFQKNGVSFVAYKIKRTLILRSSLRYSRMSQVLMEPSLETKKQRYYLRRPPNNEPITPRISCRPI